MLYGYKDETWRFTAAIPHRPLSHIVVLPMAPVAINHSEQQHDHIADLKAKIINNVVEIEQEPSPVADNYMYDLKYNHELPTHAYLGVSPPDNVDAQAVAEELVAGLAAAWTGQDPLRFTDLFLEHGECRSCPMSPKAALTP